MIFASYFCNKLNLDHRLGAELFEHYLLGFNPINNQAGWMWCGGLGNDSVPYPGRVFNISNQLYKYGKPA
jgi:deoxyribodipyrimidine photo-lyase